jgi:hypothetical protein
MVISRLLEPKRANGHKVNHQATGGRATDSLRTHPRSYAVQGIGGICTAGELSSEKVASFITPIDCLTVPNVSEGPLGVYHTGRKASDFKGEDIRPSFFFLPTALYFSCPQDLWADSPKVKPLRCPPLK